MLAARNLLQDRTRLVLSVGGVGLAVMLVVLLSGFVDGLDSQVSSYADHSPGSIVVAQSDVDTLMVATSSLPAGAADAAARVPGVAAIAPIVSRLTILDLHGAKQPVYLIGYDAASGGGPWRLDAGSEPASDDEIVVDTTLASRHALAVGSTVDVLGRGLRVSGISRGTTTWMLSYVFVRRSAAESLLRAPGIPSFLLVTTGPEADPLAVRGALAALPGLSAHLKPDVVAKDRAYFTKFFAPPIRLMAGIAFLVGALVVGMVLYSATVERQREYGVLKAIGARSRMLYRVALTQALLVSVAGSAIGLGLAFGTAEVVMALRPQFLIVYLPLTVAVALTASVGMAVVATVLPARVLAGLAPADVFRR